MNVKSNNDPSEIKKKKNVEEERNKRLIRTLCAAVYERNPMNLLNLNKLKNRKKKKM